MVRIWDPRVSLAPDQLLLMDGFSIRSGLTTAMAPRRKARSTQLQQRPARTVHRDGHMAVGRILRPDR